MNQADIDILKLSEAGRAALAHIDEVRALLDEEQQARHAAGTRVALLEGLLAAARAGTGFNISVSVLDAPLVKVVADAITEAYGHLVEVDLEDGGCRLTGIEVTHIEAATRILGDAVSTVRGEAVAA